MSACASSLEGEEAGFCWAVEVAGASGEEEGVGASQKPSCPAFPSGSHNLPCCLSEAEAVGPQPHPSLSCHSAPNWTAN